MSKDVRIEIIYYKESTDVSLEFGLHGDYPVRMLSTSCDDLEGFFKALKRAVWRSEIIILIGGYTSKEYIPAFVARALSLGVTVPDYKSERIISPEIFSIPDKASPLASSDRKFGGFILESGPQTIISLTEDKDVRLKITKEIIVRYISEHYAVFNLNKYFDDKAEAAEENEPQTAEPSAYADNVIDDTDDSEQLPFDGVTDISSNSVKAYDENGDTAFTSEDEDTAAVTVLPPVPVSVDDRVADNVIPAETYDEITEDKETGITVTPEEKSEADAVADKYANHKLSTPEGFLDIDPDDINIVEKTALGLRPHHRVIRILCIILSLITLICGTLYVLFKEHIPFLSTKSSYYSKIAEIYHGFAATDRKNAFASLRKFNTGINSWITFENAEIDHPVISSANADSSLLTHLPDGSEDAAGSVFSSSSVDAVTPKNNLIIMGSAENGGAFVGLKRLIENNDSSDIGSMTFTNEHTTMAMSVISVFKGSDLSDFNYKKDVTAEAELKEYVLKIHGASIHSDKSDIYLACPLIILLIGIDDGEEYVAAAVPSVYSRKISIASDAPVNDNPSSSSDSSSGSPDSIIIGINDGDVEYVGKDDDSKTEQEPEISEDIVIPPVPTPKPTPSSSVSSSDTSSLVSSDVSPSHSEPSASSDISSLPSSSEVSPSAPEPTPEPEQPVYDPLLTWDVNLTVTNGGKTITGTASEIVAMIVEAEMGSSFPIEALKAQAAATYSFLITSGAASGKAPYAPMKKAQSGSINATAEAKGTIISYDGKMAQTYYYAYSAGKTACNQHIWQWNNWQNTAAIPYLQSVDSSPDETLSNFETTTYYTSDDVKKKIEKMGLSTDGISKDKWIDPYMYDSNNLYCIRVKIAGKDYQGQALRNNLFGLYSGSNKDGLRSSAYTVSYDSATDKFTVVCKGWGHGVGMSQEGARLYAKDGWSYRQILEHYYNGTTVTKY